MGLLGKEQKVLRVDNKNGELETTDRCSRRRFLRYAFDTVLVASCIPLTRSHAGDKNASCRGAKFDQTLRFAIISDGHWGENGTLGDYRKNFAEMVAWLNEEQVDHGLDLVIFNGDIMNDDPHQLSEAKAVLDKLKTPLYVAKGNHDRVDDGIWEKTWGTPPNHDFEMGGYAFVIANTSNIHGKYLCPDDGWIDQRFAHYADRKQIFLIMHICPSGLGKKSKTCPEVIASIERCENLAAVFHGHDHSFDGHRELNGVNYFWDGRFGASGGLGYKGYRIVEAHSDGTIFSYQFDRAARRTVNKTTISPNITD